MSKNAGELMQEGYLKILRRDRDKPEGATKLVRLPSGELVWR